MPQYFSPAANTITRGAILIAVCGVLVLFWAITGVSGSGYITNQGDPREQPVPFSHEHHVGGLGIDCRYCHTTVEYSSTANIPPTKICMNCHSEMWAAAPMLAPV